MSSKEKLFLMHSDGCGSKSILAYLFWKETGSLAGFEAVAEDALVMNTDDLLAVGVSDSFVFTSALARHKRRIPEEVLATLIAANESFIERLSAYDIRAQIIGGETADMGEVVRTLVVDATVAAWVNRDEFIDAVNIKPGAFIVGLASSGQTAYEKAYNSGMGSNGLTSARHDLLKKSYLKKYPETVDDTTDSDYLYCGDYALTDPLPGLPSATQLSVGEGLLSPTRTYLPVLRRVFKHFEKNRGVIQGILHLTGGGQTKGLKFGRNIHYVKDNLFPFPPIFTLLSAKTPMKEMFEVYNCGHRLEVIVETESAAREIIDIAGRFQLEARIVGRTSEHTADTTAEAGNRVTILHENQHYDYTL